MTCDEPKGHYRPPESSYYIPLPPMLLQRDPWTELVAEISWLRLLKYAQEHFQDPRNRLLHHRRDLQPKGAASHDELMRMCCTLPST